MANDAPRVAFLGMVERFRHIRDGNTNLMKYNLLGLKTIALSPVFPLPLPTPGLVFALYEPTLTDRFIFRCRNDDGEEVGQFEITLQDANVENAAPPPELAALTREIEPIIVGKKAWMFVVLPVGALGALITKPGTFSIFLIEDGQENSIGYLQFVLIDPEPLTEARKAALRSNPTAMKYARAVVQCKECKLEVKAYTGLDRSADNEAQGFTWYEDLPYQFGCSCGKVNLDLSIWRRNLHGLLAMAELSSAGDDPLYKKGALTSIHLSFGSIMQEKAHEERFQRFLEDNPVLFHQFGPEQIFSKPPVLSFRKADFAILNHQRELILIELQRPDLCLLKGDGVIHHELQKEIGQVTEWLAYADEHRSAFLACLKFSSCIFRRIFRFP